MPSQTNEQALEAAIEQTLTGTTLERLKEDGTSVREAQAGYHTPGTFVIGDATDFDARYALDKHFFWEFLENTQQDELDKLKRSSDWQLKILERYDRMVKKYGLLRLMRKGLEVEDAHLTLLYQLPLASSSKTIQDNFNKNRFSISRQVRYNPENLREEIDMVVFTNGVPIATLELKNHWTGQNAATHGVKQYKYDRDFRQPLLNFGRCLVHFAVDTDEVFMTTKLTGASTFFLPFNKGNNSGKGNPVNPFGHKTAYLWEEVFQPKSLVNIIQHFVRFDGKSTDKLATRTLFFPRYHQLDVVRKLIDDVSHKGVGQTYLIQHSAGSGKSNSITWAAYQLIETYPATAAVPGAKSLEHPLFDSVIVVTDRRILDKQLRDNIREFSEVKNILAPARSSQELKDSLEQGKKIIITTIQKFPFIIDGISDLSDRRFAVIIDEAHSSQGGTTAGKMNQAMGMAETDEDEEDGQDKILKAMKARKMKGNASYFAFTATPKNATLERFGTKQEDGRFKPFHLYSMKQAIEEGFILDVLANYTTYKSYYEIEKSIEDNPLFDTAKAQKKLRAFVEKDKRTIATKAELMMEHFITKVVNTKKLKGKAKSIVVTQSIESAIRYYQAINTYLESKGNPFQIIVAFSGKKKVDGIEYTEADLNGFADSETKDQFDTDAYRMLVVANKYLTGFDQPKLATMYVDKKLQGVLAVQALSRLNRSAFKYGKKTEDLFVLDFFNKVDDIQESFEPFYTSTTLSKATDVNVLHELKDALDEVGVYEWAEVEDFVEKYFDKVDAQQLSPIIDTAANRFNVELDLEDGAKADFKIKAKQFVKIYGQMAAIMPYEMLVWEKLFWFLKFLIPKLIVKDPDGEAIDELLESVDLSTYGLERTKVNEAIVLDDGESELDPQKATPRGAHGSTEETDELNEIIKSFNERWFQGWDSTPDEQRIKLLTLSKSIEAHPDYELKYLNNPDTQNKELALHRMFKDVLNKQRKQDMELYRLTAKDESFYQGIFDTMKRIIDHSQPNL
ncbi:type I restriction endonuclease subunit R [Leeuwenhoekiella aequorea]|uniref:Type I restriction enzyme R subunit n=1 Tax=Leeuwenhoekiella aequorea TaxID=283736 RepID=A0A4Q0P5M4_9FLAO|nr:DEAD/DEAH box helicase family protein [Leeuwenhoekiella aequorea]RXG21920.1 type I restriction enzyme R subunit [Leeuwenhoekiella aequorea]